MSLQKSGQLNFNTNMKITKAIVVLSGGCQKGVIELSNYQYQNLSHQSMKRVRVGARLAKAMSLSILLTSGVPDRVDAKDLSKAKLMSLVLKE